jgi:biotin operon repressor
MVSNSPNDRQEYLKNVMELILARLINMISAAPNCSPEIEFAPDDSFLASVCNSGVFPRSCSTVPDPVSEIERLASQVLASSEFRDALVTRFVSQDTRYFWFETSLRVYDQCEQIQLTETPSSTRNVRLFWLAEHAGSVERMQYILTIFNAIQVGQMEQDAAFLSILSGLRDSILPAIARRNFVSEESIRTMVDVSRTTVGHNLEALEAVFVPIINGQQYLSVPESHEFVHRVIRAFTSLTLVSAPDHIHETRVDPVVLGESDTATVSLTFIELISVFGSLDRAGIAGDWLGGTAGLLVEGVPAGEMLDTLFKEEAGIRWLISNDDPSGVVVLKILHRIDPVSVAPVFAEFPERRDKLIRAWEMYTGPDSEFLFRVLLQATGLRNDSDSFSAFFQRLVNTGADKLRVVSRAIMNVDIGGTWAEINRNTQDTVTEFWRNSRRENVELFVITLLGFGWIVSPESGDEFCRVLQGLEGVMKRISDESVRSMVSSSFSRRCPDHVTLTNGPLR